MALTLTLSLPSKTSHPKLVGKEIQYGTAGFRTLADDLDFVMYRMGLLAVLRSKCTKAVIGIMITASHNPLQDNGVKLVDPHGEMLDQKWEKLATDIVNVGDGQLESVLLDIIRSESIEISEPGKVFVGRDTRPSGVALLNSAIDGIKDLHGELRDFGIVTTPMLHYFVDESNKGNEAWVSSYFAKLTKAFKHFCGEISISGAYSPKIVFDGANGVGAIKMGMLASFLDKDFLEVEIHNGGEGILNFECGADFVKVQQKLPKGLEGIKPGEKGVSVDGDADRIVYFYLDDSHVFHLLDGDKIASLVAGYINELLQECKLKLNLGVVQTAYANGASTKYITENLKIPVDCVSTGVKYLHHKALERDIGVYFEANGHGTVVFSKAALEVIEKASVDQSLLPSERLAAAKLNSLLQISNPAVGDALSDILLVESVLRSKHWGLKEWEVAYTDLPNRLLKVKVEDKNNVQTTDAGRRCTAPAGLQEEIDKLVKSYPSGRSFVRSSGTEDAVRIYAESDTQRNADELATKVAIKVYQMAGGVGEAPSPPSV
ncbi:phosphoacetylglucosamine mutase [Ischnura elegans]|uniref:phosphoacetylglucosamine mutase n=1 Tax=Ischnura elegans TaxID=197161 RepID=UPI001ED8B471|nr:phosphoacetylglucosamine mutase [Ischnura elegans]